MLVVYQFVHIETDYFLCFLAFSLVKGSLALLLPSAPVVLLAASLHHVCASDRHGFSTLLSKLRPETNKQYRQVRGKNLLMVYEKVLHQCNLVFV